MVNDSGVDRNSGGDARRGELVTWADFDALTAQVAQLSKMLAALVNQFPQNGLEDAEPMRDARRPNPRRAPADSEENSDEKFVEHERVQPNNQENRQNRNNLDDYRMKINMLFLNGNLQVEDFLN